MHLQHRRNVYRRDKYTCRYCGTPHTNLTIDHILPRSRGGHPEKKANLVTSCLKCNQRKADRTPEEAGMFILSEGFSYTPPGKLDDNVKELSPIKFRTARLSRKKRRRMERARRKALWKAYQESVKHGTHR